MAKLEIHIMSTCEEASLRGAHSVEDGQCTTSLPVEHLPCPWWTLAGVARARQGSFAPGDPSVLLEATRDISNKLWLRCPGNQGFHVRCFVFVETWT